MNRRKFLTAVVGGVTSITIAPQASIAMVQEQTVLPSVANILSAFPINNTLIDDVIRANFMMERTKNEEGYCVNIKPQDADNSITAEEVIAKLKDEVEFVDGIADTGQSLNLKMWKASVQLSENGNGPGKYYFYDPTEQEVYLFYSGVNVFDSPIVGNITDGYNILPNFTKYFMRIKATPEAYAEWLEQRASSVRPFEPAERAWQDMRDNAHDKEKFDKHYISGRGQPVLSKSFLKSINKELTETA